MIHLEPSAVRRYHQSVNFDLAAITQPRKYMNLPNKEGNDADDGAVRVGFDPVSMFLSDLRVSIYSFYVDRQMLNLCVKASVQRNFTVLL